MKYKTHIIWAAVAVIALVGGIVWGKGMAAASGGGQQSANGTFSSSTRGNFAARGGSSGNVFAGQVSAIGGSDITLQLPNGNSEAVLYSSSTTVTEPTKVSISKVAPGSNIVVVGTKNSDGSVTASSIEIGGGGIFRDSAGGAGGQVSTSGLLGQ